MKMHRVTLVGAVLLMAAAVVFAQTAPVVTITYDDDFNGTGAKGVVKGTPQGEHRAELSGVHSSTRSRDHGNTA